MSATVQTDLRQELAAIAADAGCELLDLEHRGSVLRLVLDRPEGVTLADCETVSKQASAVLDVHDFGAARYVLEVTSPGLDRKLYGPRDYRRFVGRQVRVTWQDAAMPRKRTVVGRLEAFAEEGGGRIRLTDPQTNEGLDIALESVQKARLEPQI